MDINCKKKITEIEETSGVPNLSIGILIVLHSYNRKVVNELSKKINKQ